MEVHGSMVYEIGCTYDLWNWMGIGPILWARGTEYKNLAKQLFLYITQSRNTLTQSSPFKNLYFVKFLIVCWIEDWCLLSEGTSSLRRSDASCSFPECSPGVGGLGSDGTQGIYGLKRDISDSVYIRGDNVERWECESYSGGPWTLSSFTLIPGFEDSLYFGCQPDFLKKWIPWLHIFYLNIPPLDHIHKYIKYSHIYIHECVVACMCIYII